MKILIRNGRLIDPATGRDEPATWPSPPGASSRSARRRPTSTPTARIDATRLDRRARPGRPGGAAARAGPRARGHARERARRRRPPAASPAWSARPTPTRRWTSPAWSRCSSSAPRKLSRCRLFPLGALTRGLAGEALTEMAELTEAGCVGFSQAEVAAARHAGAAARAAVRRDLRLHGLAAPAGPLARRRRGRQRRRSPRGSGLSGVPVAAETDRAAHHLRAGARHRRARAPVPAVERGRRGAGARGQGRRPAGDAPTSASTRCT